MAIYENTECYVQINSLFTDKFYAEPGVRQGGPLSSTLFSVYNNDFPSFINKENIVDMDTNLIGINCLLFADDIVLIGISETDLQSLSNRAYME